MPILAGLLSSAFGALFTLFAARLSIGVAAAAAFVAVSSAAFVAVKVALAAVAAGLGAISPPVAAQLAGYFFPGNVGTCLTAILLADAIATSYDYWRNMIGVAVQLARG